MRHIVLYGLVVRERYANHILCHEDLRGILEAWDRAEKKIFHGGVVLYRIR
jgi:hypothetical protein